MMDLETCSLCLHEVKDHTLRRVTRSNAHIYEGARICLHCRLAHPDIKTDRS